MNREDILNKLTVLDFMAVDLQLFLDTHPDNEKAIEKYNEVIREADSVRCQYEKLYGPLCSFRSMSSAGEFRWINNPWPWSEKFNYSLAGEDC